MMALSEVLKRKEKKKKKSFFSPVFSYYLFESIVCGHISDVMLACIDWIYITERVSSVLQQNEG